MPLIASPSTLGPFPANGDAFIAFDDFIMAPGMVADQVWWDIEPLDGWDSPAASEGGSAQRVGDHGVWMEPSYYGGRVVEVSGKWVSQSWAAVSAVRNALKAAVPQGRLVDMIVSEPGEALTAKVRLEGDLLIHRDGAVTTFSFSVIAPDPRRYSLDPVTVSTGLPQTTGGFSLPLAMPFTIPAVVTSGVLQVTNDGDMDTRPTLTITGPTPAGARITHRGTGGGYYLADTVAAGRFVTIDTDRGVALLDGVTPTRMTGVGFEYAPGVNEVAFTAPSYNSGALLTSSHRSAWR